MFEIDDFGLVANPTNAKPYFEMLKIKARTIEIIKVWVGIFVTTLEF